MDWKDELEQYIQECHGKDHEWGEFDCAIFAANCIKIKWSHERDPAKKFRGKYSNREEAFEIIDGEGGWISMVSSELGEPVGPFNAVYGDPVLCKIPTGNAARMEYCLGTYIGGGKVLFPAATGLTAFRTSLGVVGWNV